MSLRIHCDEIKESMMLPRESLLEYRRSVYMSISTLCTKINRYTFKKYIGRTRSNRIASFAALCFENKLIFSQTKFKIYSKI